MRTSPPLTPHGARRGFSLFELMFALVIGVIVLGSATALATGVWRDLARSEVREEMSRDIRFLGASLDRDLKEVGVGIEATPAFGTLAALRDTVSILRVPFEPEESPAYPLAVDEIGDPFLPPGGTCGAHCIDVIKGGAPFAIRAGDLARLQVSSDRRLILVSAVTERGDTASVSFVPIDSVLLGRLANFAAGLRLGRFGTYIQKLRPTVYWLEGGQLMRAERIRPGLTLDGQVVATNVESFTASLVFVNGSEAAAADGNDASDENDYDKIRMIRIRTTLAADDLGDRAAVSRVRRTVEWRFAPRNLTYQRNDR